MAYSEQRSQMERYERDSAHALTLDEWAAKLAALDDSYPAGYAPSHAPLLASDLEPGSVAKMALMRQRYLRQENLHHCRDRQVGDPNPIPGQEKASHASDR